MSMGKTKLYIGGLGDRISRHDLEREFERFGHLREAWVARKPPGFGFIEFDDPRDASDAVRDMDGNCIMGMRIKVEYAKKMGREPSKVAPRYGGRDSPRHSRERYYSPDRYRSRKHSPEDRHSGRSRRRSPSPYRNRRHRSRSEESNEHKKIRRDRSRTRSRSRSYDKHHSNRYSRSPRSRERKDRYSNSPSHSPPDNKNGDDNSPAQKRRSQSGSD